MQSRKMTWPAFENGTNLLTRSLRGEAEMSGKDEK